MNKWWTSSKYFHSVLLDLKTVYMDSDFVEDCVVNFNLTFIPLSVNLVVFKSTTNL